MRAGFGSEVGFFLKVSELAGNIVLGRVVIKNREQFVSLLSLSFTDSRVLGGAWRSPTRFFYSRSFRMAFIRESIG